MKRSWLLSLLVALTLAFLNMPAFAQSDSMEDMNAAIGALTSKVNAMQKAGLSVEVHGFVQADYINDSTQSFTETVGDGAVKQNGSFAGDNGYTQFSERNSRFDFLAKSEVDGWLTKGYFEMDLLGYEGASTPGYGASAGGNLLATQDSEVKFYTQPTVRLRHAYLEASNDGWDILAGQYWSLFGWNMDYVLATVSEAPTMGPLYFRTPQLRITKTFGDDKGMQVAIAADAEKPDEITSQVPNLNFGLRLTLNDIKGEFCQSTGGYALKPLSIGLGLRNSLITWDSLTGAAGANFNINQSMWASAVAADVLIPVLSTTEEKAKDDVSVVLTGEWTMGAGDTDAFNGGGFTGLTGFTSATAGVGTNIDGGILGSNGTSLQLVQIQSLTAQMQIALPKSIGAIITVGYGEIFSPNALGLGATWNDDKVMFANVMEDLTPAIRVGLEYASYDTHYSPAFGGVNNFTDAIDNRCQLSTWYRF
jgi:hypothetical protein